jgi:MFS superfamily sulfate permease-like transporter
MLAGAVGVSLCIFALEVTFPEPSPHLTFANIFSIKHLPLLTASVLPAVLICIFHHINLLGKLLNGFPSYPLYLPACCFAITAIFWTIVAANNISAKTLESAGWLFKAKAYHTSTLSVASWNYWRLFDFAKVEWGALSATFGDMVLLVLVGVLTLPIYVSISVIDLKASDHSMNHDFVGHGVANVLIGLMGTLPAIMVSCLKRAKQLI